jgi:transposase InsO family protein
MYNISKPEQDKLRKYVDENVAKGFIQVSSSPAGAPIFYVKVDGKADRPCVDYWILNGMTVRDFYPLLVISQLLNNLHGCKFLSKIDLKAAFNLLRVAPGLKWKTAFHTPWGLYEYQVMPFGLANAPATFQRFIQHVLREYLDICCFVYIDDILIFLQTEENHIRDLRHILDKLQQYSLKTSLSKCEFFFSTVTFLGFDITKHGLQMNEKKLDMIKDLPYPTNLEELRQFLGFTIFYRWFIPWFSEVAGPLTTLTKDDVGEKVSWRTDGSVVAFERLKTLFQNKLLLCHFSFDKACWVHVDSSGFAIAAVLSQPDNEGNLQPVSFFLQNLTDRERSWMIFDLELLAIVKACEEWRAWLMGTSEPFKIFSDHSNLLYFKTAKHLSPKQACWALFLDNFNMLIYHISGSKNPADAPSRREDYTACKKLTPKAHTVVWKMVNVEPMEGVPTVVHGFHDLAFQWPSQGLLDYFGNHYSAEELADKQFQNSYDIVWYQSRVLVPADLRLRILKMYHDAPTVGHPGIARTLLLVLRKFLWPGLRKMVTDFVKSCDLCQRVKAQRQAKDGQLVPIVATQQPWSVIGMDMITKLPISGGFDLILVVIDLLSKMTHFMPCKESSSSAILANLFCKNVFRLHGLPDKIISDRGSTFVSKFWRSLMVSLNIQSALSTAYHPQTDGQTERMNQVLEDYLRHFCSYYQDNWDKVLDMAEFSINNLDSGSLEVSPFFFSYGHHPCFNILTENKGRKDLDDFILELQLKQEKAMECLVQARQQQVLNYNKNKKPSPVYQEGDKVLLLRKFIQLRRLNSKLDYRYIGPFKVKKMVGSNAVKLDIQKEYPKLHPVFNLSLIVRYVGSNELVNRGVNDEIKKKYYDDGDIVDWNEMNMILDARMVKKGKYEYLVSWKNSTTANNIWISEDHFPEAKKSYLTGFRKLHEELFGGPKAKKSKSSGIVVGESGV